MASSLSRKTAASTTTPDQQQLLDAYETLLACSGRMLKAAREADWEALIDLQGTYLTEIEMLRHLEDAEVALDDDGRQRKAALLEQLLAQDREIRQRLNDRRNELSSMILDSKHELALTRTYRYYQEVSEAEVIEATQRFKSS
ncbi:MAG: flagellar protein FliT [Halochromatium sp.]|uniref:flagellar protein FliT n=1 Tax=Halochromatium sp. TaxID=2049430 RepID=UPI00397E5088